MNRLATQFIAALLFLVVFAGTGCVNLGSTIRIEGTVVDQQGQPVADVRVIGTAMKRGGLFLTPAEIMRLDPTPQRDERRVSIKHHDDGAFTAVTRFTSSMTLSFYDAQGEEFRVVRGRDGVLVPNLYFTESSNNVRIEVATHDRSE